MKKNILVTGGSGTVGRELLSLLSIEKSYNVTAFDLKNKKNTRVLNKYKKDIKIVYGDICDFKSVYDVCKDQDVIIHLAALIPPKADLYPDLAYKINVLGTQNIIDSILQHGNKSFLFYSSSVSVYGDRIENPYITISDPLIPSEGDYYGASKVEVERRIQNSAINWSIFRLTAIMGTGNHKIGEIMFHMPLETAMEIASPEDTALAFVKAIEKRDLLNKKIFNLSGGEKCRITFEEYLQRSFKAYGLGNLNFPLYTFAKKNFHCGYYLDSDELENILHFRNDTIESHFKRVNQNISSIQKFFTYPLKWIIKRNLLKLSEPYRAFLAQDKNVMSHFFNKKEKE